MLRGFMPKSRDADAAALEDYLWLTSPAADAWLTWAAASRLALTAKVAQLRTELSPRKTHLIMEQVALRDRAGEKFSAAEKMFFTPRSLEQATDEVVAAYKAERFSNRPRIFDLCCGIGGDLFALARQTETSGFDRDPTIATLAAANARVLFDESRNILLASRRPEVHLREVEELDLADCSAWHIDPDRRPGGRRTTRVELHEPARSAIDRLLGQNSNASVKLAPAAQLPDSWSQSAELEWISRGRECRQLVAWFGDLAHVQGERRATVLGSGQGRARSIVGSRMTAPPPTAEIGRYLFEPDAAVLAAKLGDALAAEHALAAIAPGIAYWTGRQAISDPALACFEVLEVLPFRIKPLKELLRARRVGRLEIKKRGVELDPDATRQRLVLAGDEAATLLVARIGKRVTAILARRVAND
jgi:SAM-dependent methyltransferase